MSTLYGLKNGPYLAVATCSYVVFCRCMIITASPQLKHLSGCIGTLPSVYALVKNTQYLRYRRKMVYGKPPDSLTLTNHYLLLNPVLYVAELNITEYGGKNLRQPPRDYGQGGYWTKIQSAIHGVLVASKL